MPQMPPTHRGAGYRPPAVRDRERGSQRERGYTRRWEKARLAFLMAHPLCACGCERAATEVDHIIPHRGDDRLFWDETNWQPLTRECHSRKTATERGRGG